MAKNYDFAGWATRNNMKCSDGRVIMPDAFKHNDKKEVPLVWNHRHDDPYNVLGHALLENRPEGVYAYCTFNENESGKNAKGLVKHGDIVALSIFANKLQQQPEGDCLKVMHGEIREVSLVLAGANPGAYIDSVFEHGEKLDDQIYIFSGEELDFGEEFSHDDSDETEETIEHAEEKKDEEEPAKMEPEKKETGKTVKDVFDGMTEEEQNVVYYMIGEALKQKNGTEEKEDMKHNVFDQDEERQLAHTDMNAVMNDFKHGTPFSEAYLAHAELDDNGEPVEYGIANIDYLYPEAKTLNNPPEFIKRNTEWVDVFMRGVHHTPFARIKSMFADITKDDARAKGYVKGNLKMEEVFALLKRTTTPTTVYKKQKLDRDDLVDITDFDVVAWMKREMRGMLDEEIARAALIGDQRNAADEDKIDPLHIRPIWTDAELYTVHKDVTVTNNDTPDSIAKKFIRMAVKARKDYKGSGNPILFTTEDILTDCLLLEDGMGRPLYDTEEKLRTALRVARIVTVPVMENLEREVEGVDHELMGIIVNLNDYNIGADKGGAVNMFDDFDIDYNQMKYLIETRCSGALVKPKSAIVIEKVAANG